jgi:CRISP-associated protein Cas1
VAILPTHKNGIVYVEHCRVVMSDERLSYIRKKDAVEKHWSIPYGNTNILLLGPGTSLTQQAARFLADEGVMVGFTGGGGVPLYFASQNEYRPTEYLQKWVSFWFDEKDRLGVAKQFQLARCEAVRTGFYSFFKARVVPAQAIEVYQGRIKEALTNQKLMGYEAGFAKSLYALLAEHFNVKSFRRTPKSRDLFNRNLDQGNYLAYGLAACALWILGIPHSLPVSHGMTRRGALVFDVADIVKDACILPNAFISAMDDETESEFRGRCVKTLDERKALKIMMDNIIEACNRA